MAKEKETEVKDLAPTKVTNPGALAVSDDLMAQLLADQGAGTSGMTADDVALPRYTILQQLSPMCTRGKAEYDPEAKPGDIFNSVMGKLYNGDKGFEAILCAYERKHIQWKLRSKGGGFIEDHGSNGDCLTKLCTKDSFGSWIVNANPESEIVPTAEYYAIILLEDGSTERGIFDLAKSQMKHARALNAKITSYQPTVAVKQADGTSKDVRLQMAPIFYRSYFFKTGGETNKKGDAWMGWDITPGRVLLEIPEIGKDLYLAARKFKAQIEAGEVKVAPPDGGTAPDGGDGGDEDKPPF